MIAFRSSRVEFPAEPVEVDLLPAVESIDLLETTHRAGPSGEVVSTVLVDVVGVFPLDRPLEGVSVVRTTTG